MNSEVIAAVLRTHGGVGKPDPELVEKIATAIPTVQLDELVVLLDQLWVKQPYAVAHELLRRVSER